jgi:hypothetical protein
MVRQLPISGILLIYQEKLQYIGKNQILSGKITIYQEKIKEYQEIPIF